MACARLETNQLDYIHNKSAKCSPVYYVEAGCTTADRLLSLIADSADEKLCGYVVALEIERM